jgi:hypothetical protein
VLLKFEHPYKLTRFAITSPRLLTTENVEYKKIEKCYTEAVNDV